MAETIIIGGGIAGLGAAHFLSENAIDAIIHEKRKEPDKDLFAPYNGFKIDYSSHIVLTPKWGAKLFNTSKREKKTNEWSNIRHILKGYSIKHPLIENLNELPRSLVIKIVNEISELNTQNEGLAYNLKDWLYASYGKTYTDLILERFIQKIYTLPPEKIDLSEIKNEFERSSFKDILIGALTNKIANTNGKHKRNFSQEAKQSEFHRREKPEIRIKYDYAIETIELKNKIVTFENGEKENYNYLISSIPLPNLINYIDAVPDNIKSATEKLANTSCIVVNIGTQKKILSNSHCSYFYDSDILFSQLIYPDECTEKNIPGINGNIQALIHFSRKYKPLYLQPKNFIEPVISNLKRCNILQKENKIVNQTAKLLPYANIIHDFKRRHSLLTIHKFLKDNNIFYCGRYGLWTNLKIEESYESGIDAAKEVKFLVS